MRTGFFCRLEIILGWNKRSFLWQFVHNGKQLLPANAHSGMLMGRISPFALASAFLIFLKCWVKTSGIKHKSKHLLNLPINKKISPFPLSDVKIRDRKMPSLFRFAAMADFGD